MKDFKRELVKYGKLIYAHNLVVGSGGNISVRVKNKIYIKASKVSLENSAKKDYNEIDIKTGRTKCFKGACSVETPMHAACYKARPDIGAVIHTHPVYGTIVGMLVKKMGPVSYESMFVLSSEVPVINYKRPGTKDLAEAVGNAIKKYNAVLLKRHGAVVVGCDIKEAYEKSVVLERACKIYVLSKLAGKISLP